MKKTKHIRLVLVTAVLASCNQTIIPHQTLSTNDIDSTLLDYKGHEANYYCDCNQQTLSQTNNIMLLPNNQFISILPNTSAIIYPYRKSTQWKNGKIIQRGGFGKRVNYSGS